MKFIDTIFLSMITFTLFSNNFNLEGKEYLSPFPSPYSLTFVEDGKINITWYNQETDDWDNHETFNYELSIDQGLPIIEIDGKLPQSLEEMFGSPKNNYGNKIVFLAGFHTESERNVSISYISKNNEPSIFLLDIPNYESLSRTYREASSVLIEFGKEYSLKNLGSLDPESSWVEGVEGHGIGQSFVIENSWGNVYPYLFIMNGFISFDKPELYKQNGRVKKILVEDIVSKASVTCNVLDTPNPQTVNITKLNSSNDLRITILEVYEGDKYQDTAIHYLVTYNNKITPFN